MWILIADDEYLVRSSLKSMLEELNLPLDFIGEATNGEELIALAGLHLPDIAFVDIRMPKLNGLEAIRRGKAISPRTKWFILTGFSEFEYAKEAIQLGVCDYLLKPVSPEELNRVLSGFFEENKKEIAAQNEQFERELMALQHGLTRLEFEHPESVLRNAHFLGAVFTLDSHLPEKDKAERQFKFSHTLRASIEQRSEANNCYALIVLLSGELAVIGTWKSIHKNQAELQVRRFFKDLEQELRNFSDPDAGITMLVSQECEAYPDLHAQLELLHKLAPLRIVCGVGQVLYLPMLCQQAEEPGRTELCNLALSISRYYQEKNYLNYCKALQDLGQFISRSNLVENLSLNKAVNDFFQRSIHCSLSSWRDLRLWTRALQQHGERLLLGTSKEEIPGFDLVDQVLAFVDQNYMHDIGLGQISERLYITPNYLSTIFHKKTGINFMSYLKKVRMLKSKELLNDPNIQIQQVAERVGYLSSRHFARLFSEQFGCLPSEYRDRLKKNG